MNNKSRPVAIALLVLSAIAFNSPSSQAGPKTTTTSRPSSSSTSSSSSRTWGSGSSSSSSARPNAAPASYGNSTATQKAADGTLTDADRALAAKARQTGAYGQSRNDAFNQNTPAPANAPALNNANGGSYGAPHPYNYNNSGSGMAPVVVYGNHPAPVVVYGGGSGYGYNHAGYAPMVGTAGVSHGGSSVAGMLILLVVFGGIAVVGYFIWQAYANSKKSVALAGGAGTAAGDSIGGVALNQPHSEGTSFDPHLSGDWDRVNPGALITLSDPLSGLTGKEFTVSKVGTLTELDGLARWHVFHFENEAGLRLMVTTVDKEISMYRLEATDVEPATRQGLLDQNLSVFFMKPDDENNFQPGDLRYTMQFDDWESADKKHVTTYVQKGQGEMHGEYIQRPAPSGDAGTLDGTVVEYAAAGGENADPDHPYLVILETGGLVETFLGSKALRFSEIRVENV